MNNISKFFINSYNIPLIPKIQTHRPKHIGSDRLMLAIISYKIEAIFSRAVIFVTHRTGISLIACPVFPRHKRQILILSEKKIDACQNHHDHCEKNSFTHCNSPFSSKEICFSNSFQTLYKIDIQKFIKIFEYQ